jgi:hypothetical protein
MIRRELKSQVNDLEKRIVAAVQMKRNEADAPAHYARIHALAVAAVALYGEPKIKEELRIAQSRMVEKLDKKFAAVVEVWRIREGVEEVDVNHVTKAGYLYPHLMFDDLSGDNDNLKLEQIFSEAPAWLLKFTAVEWDAKILGFKLPELVGTPELGRYARVDRNSWPVLPHGTINEEGPCLEPDEPWEKIVKRRCREMLELSL